MSTDTSDADASALPAIAAPSFGEATRAWTKIGLQSFGGPAAQISVMHRVLVEEKRWISEERFLHALNYCMLLPGPEAQQLTVYIGWLLHGVRGGLVAGTLFVLPGFVTMLALSVAYVALADLSWVTAIFAGLKAAVIAVVLEAVIRVSRRALRGRAQVLIAVVAFIALHLFGVPFPAIVLGAAVLGACLLRGSAAPQSAGSSGAVPAVDAAAQQTRETRFGVGRSLRVLATAGGLWWAPILACAAWLGWRHVLTEEGLFFSRMAAVTFGGAYAVLAYLQQQAVERYGWVRSLEMADGLALAESTPGPLIMVVQFVGFLGAYREPAPWSPLTAGILGACLTTWVTFVPCFLWIFLGAPYVERLRNVRRLQAALAGVTSAIVGVILHVAVVFAAHTLFADVRTETRGPLQWLAPDWSTWDPASTLIAAASAVALVRWHWSLFTVLGLAAAAGLLRFLIAG
ncbi:MAG: chromate efflux transporter [Planctomyces sp.]|nr:chromate efflux transporter [Planctomyces sp.]